MKPVLIFDLISFMATIFTLIILLRGWKRALPYDVKLLLAGLLALALFHNFSNVLEWGGITNALDPFEDFFEILVPALWFLFIYAFFKNIAAHDLWESENYFRTVLHSLHEDIIVIDPNYRILDINTAFLVTSKLKREDAIGHHCFEVSHGYNEPCDKCGEECLLQEVFKTGEPRSCLHEHQQADGSKVWVDILLSPMKDENGKTIRVIETVRNIADVMRAKEALKQSEERYRTLFDETPISVMGFNKEGIIQYVNNYHIKTFAKNKHTKEFFIGKMITELPGVVGAGIADELGKILKDETIELNDIYFSKFTGGHSCYVNVRGVPLLEGSEVVGGILLREDITKIKLTEEALRQSERKLRTRNQIADIFLTASDDEMYAGVLGVVLEVMKSRFGVFGYIDDHGSLVCPSMTREIWDQCRVPDKDIVFTRDTWGGIWGRVLKEGKPFYSNGSFHVPKGHIPMNSVLSVPIILHGELIGLLTVANKETGYNENDLAFLKSIAEYIAPVLHPRLQRDRQEKRSDKLQAQLRQAQKMEAIGTLAGGIAHDFNNILFNILGFTELAILDVPDGSNIKQDLKGVLKAGRRAEDLVQQILAFSRQREQEKKPLRVSLIVKEAMKFLRASLPTTIELRQNIDKDTGIVEADSTQIHQVLMNLCTNGYHAMKEEGILKVSLMNVYIDADAEKQFPDMSSGPYLRLSVSDTGHGMPPDVKERIFEPYFTTKEIGEGTGLGLAVVHGIVKDHGGAITVYSEPGKGSTFHVYLPVIEKVAESEKETVESIPTGDECILFIDDDPGLVKIGRQMLERLGYKVSARTSSLEALELFKAKPDRFDMVITDMTMPKMAGDKLSRELIKISPDIPIIICSGFSNMIDEKKAKTMGIREHLMKPVSMQDIARTVRKVLDQ